MLEKVKQSLCQFWKWLDISPALYGIFGLCCVFLLCLVFDRER
jgi:hypothetical protein